MELQLEKVAGPHGVELGPDCLCPPVCFQCPPPFCLPCGPGPGGATNGGGDNMPGPKQCGPFIMLNTPMEQKTIMLPMDFDQHKHHHHGHHHDHEHHGRNHDHDHHGQRSHHGKHHAECCEQGHHHHHGDKGNRHCCEKEHHHHHHDGDDSDRECMKKEHHKKHHKHHDHHDHHGHKEEKAGTPRSRSRGRGRGREQKTPKTKGGRTNSRELRAGKLYIGCDCERRNGLQDDCQRSLCQGSPECCTVPPTCLPSEFSNGKHLAKRREAAEKRLRDKYKLC